MLTQQKLIENASIRLFPLKGYLREALNLKKAMDNLSDTQYKEKAPFVNFSKSLQDAIELMARALQGVPKGYDIDHDLIFKEEATEESIMQFLSAPENKKITDVLLNDRLLAELERNTKIAKRLNKWLAEPLGIAYGVLHTASFTVRFPPIDTILATFAGGIRFLRTLIQYQAMKYDPGLKGPYESKLYSAYVGFAGGLALVGIGVGMIFTGVVASFAAPILIAAGTLALTMSNLIALGSGLRDLVNEFRYHKEPAATFGLRMLKKASNCLRLASSSALYLCVSILAVAAVVALFVNPIGLAVLAGAVATIAVATACVSIASFFANKLLSKEIKKINAERLENTKILRNVAEPRYESGLKNKIKNILKNFARSGFAAKEEHPLLFEMRDLKPVAARVSENFSVQSLKKLKADIESKNSGDKAILMFFGMLPKNRAEPAQMIRLEDPKLILKFLEASKLMGVEIQFDPQDLAVMRGQTTDPKLQEIQKLFAKINAYTEEDIKNQWKMIHEKWGKDWKLGESSSPPHFHP